MANGCDPRLITTAGYNSTACKLELVPQLAHVSTIMHNPMNFANWLTAKADWSMSALPAPCRGVSDTPDGKARNAPAGVRGRTGLKRQRWATADNRARGPIADPGRPPRGGKMPQKQQTGGPPGPGTTRETLPTARAASWPPRAGRCGGPWWTSRPA